MSALPVAASPLLTRLLAGPPPAAGAEPLVAHLGRLGPRPRGGRWMLDALTAAGLRGHGGGAFPTARKWAGVAKRSRGDAVVIVNLAEGEPASAKDRVLAASRPHLLLDGALLAAETVGAGEVVVGVGRHLLEARAAVRAAIRERRRARFDPVRVRLSDVPDRYVAGETSALVHLVDQGRALPRLGGGAAHAHAVRGRPALVNNAETLAHAALLARRGVGWFRAAGTPSSPGTTLLTLGGAVARPGVVEAELGSTLSEVLVAAGGVLGVPQAVLLGGYFGTWLPVRQAAPLPLDHDALAREGAALGCGVVAVLGGEGCGVAEAALVLEYLAGQSAGQCGPCVHGLRSVADTLGRVAWGGAGADDLGRLDLWSAEIVGRGACHHPDGAIHHLRSALSTFGAEVEVHLEGGPCAAALQARRRRPLGWLGG